jgi:transposase
MTSPPGWRSAPPRARCQLLLVAWRTVGAIVTRVNAEVEARVDRLEGLRRIGIDEISYKRGHHYLIVVVDHDTGALVWASPGRNDAALNVFFDELGPERAALLTHISADMADWIARGVKKRAPNAVRCADPFHVVAWGIDLDVERRRAWNAAAGRLKTGTRPPQRPLHRHRRTLETGPLRPLEEPRRLTDRQRHDLDWEL